MSRIANKPIALPKGVELKANGNDLQVKGSKGVLNLQVHETVSFEEADGEVKVTANTADSVAMAGTMRSLISNMVTGVTSGFEKKLQLEGVGYRAQAKGKVLNLTLGFSHPVNYDVPEGVSVETPSQTEILISGMDKQQVGQVAANIRAYRPPEPYKGKGVRYAGEQILRKEAKKK